MSCDLNDGVLQALLDEELPGGDAQAVRQHIDLCPACAQGFQRIGRDASTLTAALRLLDHDRPEEAQRQSRESERRVGALRSVPSASARRFPVGRVALPWAAVLLFCFGAVASAIPGSPVRGWIAERLDIGILSISAGERAPVVTARTSGLAAPDAELGVRVEPLNGRLRVVLTRPAPELRIIARLTDLDVAWAYAVGGAAAGRFSTSAGTLEVFDAGTGEVRIDIPRLTTAATIEVDGRIHLSKDGDQLRLLSSPGDSLATEIIFEVQP